MVRRGSGTAPRARAMIELIRYGAGRHEGHTTLRIYFGFRNATARTNVGLLSPWKIAPVSHRNAPRAGSASASADHNVNPVPPTSQQNAPAEPFPRIKQYQRIALRTTDRSGKGGMRHRNGSSLALTICQIKLGRTGFIGVSLCRNFYTSWRVCRIARAVRTVSVTQH